MKNHYYIFFLLLWFFMVPTQAQEEKFKAVLIFNFGKYIEWSPQEKQGNFIIAVLGSKEMAKHLDIIASKMKVNNQPLIIKYYNTAEEVEKCHMLYISPYQSDQMQELLMRFARSNMFFITDKRGMVQQGSCINFYSKNGEVKFEISKNNIDKTGLKVNPSLLMLGKSS